MNLFSKRPENAFLWLFASWCLLGLVGCKTIKVLPPSAVVEGRISGQNGIHQPVEDVLISLRHDGTSAGRNVYRPDIPIQSVQSARLAMSVGTGLPFPEQWHLLLLSRGNPRPGSDDRSPTEFTEDPGWVRSHTGELAWLSLRRDELALPGSYYELPATSLRSGGALVLSRVEDDDPILPWISSDCVRLATLPLSATLRPLDVAGVGDCFDMQSIASLILNQLALTITEAVSAHPIRAVSHSVAIVPHITTPVDGRETRPAIGFIYRTTLEPLILGRGAGPLTGTATLSVPITWVFARVRGSLETRLDPITLTAVGNNTSRITVSAAPDSIASGFADQLRREVVNGISRMPTPTGPGGIPIDSYLDFLLERTVLSGDLRLPADFGVLALPTGNVGFVPDTTALRMGEITFVDSDHSAPGLAGGRGARTVNILDGRVEVLVNLNRSGTRVRQFRLPTPSEPLPFKLVIQR
jgi:hypothetical protein